MNWRRWFFMSTIVIVALFLYEFALPLSTAAKLLELNFPFDIWRGPITRSAIHVGSIAADVYTGSASRVPVLFVHGVNESGKDSPDLKTVAEALAGSGYRVVVPEFVRMTHQNVTPADIDDVLLVFRSFNSAGGIVCASYGCGPALIAASRPEIRDRVLFVATFGGYFNLTETLRIIVAGPPTELAYGKWVYMRGNLDLVQDRADRETLLAIANEREDQSPEEWRLGGEALGTEGRRLLALYESVNGCDFDARLNDVPKLKARLEDLSPSRYLAGIKGRLIILHMASDPSIPSSESLRMAAAAKRNGVPYSLTILNMYGHTRPSWPPVGVRSVFAFYLPEGWKFMEAVKDVLRFAP
jgi:pimeloyl-ACP methyl ester carboxylesterase